MSARRGWCPSLHEPMATGDGLLVRIKPRGGLLSARAVRRLAGAATGHGNGVLELTRRGALQLRGVSAATAPLLAVDMVAAGLASPDPGAERRRTVTLSPLAGADPGVHPATRGLAAAIETALEEAGDLALPAKFGVAVDGGGVLPLGTVGADIGVRLGEEGAAIERGGAFVTEVRIGRVVETVLALAREGGMRGPAAPCGRAVGWHGYAGGGAFGAGLAFGSADASQWVRLAELALRHGDGALRLTPWRAVLIAGVDEWGAVRSGIEEIGFIADPEDPRLRVEACPGAPACASAQLATRALASRLRPGPGTVVHVSGCEKGCAHPGPATFTLVGRDGGFDLVREGRAGEAPERVGLGEAEVLAL